MVTKDDGANESQENQRNVRGRHGANSDATRRAIRTAAEHRFRRSGYDQVTMRQIAADAGCSHTAIYRYFPDKEALLEAVAAPVLEGIGSDFDVIAALEDSWEERLVAMSLRFVRFGLANRSMFRLFIVTHAGRVDRKPTGGTINALRLGLFEKLRRALEATLNLPRDDEQSLQYARGLYYLLHGMIGTYEESQESDEELMRRLEPVFITAIRSLIAGFRGAAIVNGG